MDSDLLVTITKDIALTAAAITGTVIAIKGLGTWRQQLKGQSDYELSRRILVALFIYRDAIDGVRHPMMISAEMPYPEEAKAKHMNDREIHHHGKSKAYHSRIEKVKHARKSLYTDLLEAEALWDNELNTLFDTLYHLEQELIAKIRNHLVVADPRGDEKHKKKTAEKNNQTRDIMFDSLSDEGDEYKLEFTSGVEAIEAYLKPKLRGH